MAIPSGDGRRRRPADASHSVITRSCDHCCESTPAAAIESDIAFGPCFDDSTARNCRFLYSPLFFNYVTQIFVFFSERFLCRDVLVKQSGPLQIFAERRSLGPISRHHGSAHSFDLGFPSVYT